MRIDRSMPHVTTMTTLNYTVKDSQVWGEEDKLKEQGYVKYVDYFILGKGRTRQIHIIKHEEE